MSDLCAHLVDLSRSNQNAVIFPNEAFNSSDTFPELLILGRVIFTTWIWLVGVRVVDRLDFN